MKFFSFFLIIFFAFTAKAQIEERRFPLKTGGSIEIENLYGRVSVRAEEAEEEKVVINFQSSKSIKDSDVKIEAKSGKVLIVVKPENAKTRIDLEIKIPIRSRVQIETRDGEVELAGNIEKASITTDTGTISTDVPTDDLRYDFVWTRSRPRYLSDVSLDEVEEKSAGKFSVNGKFGETKEERERRKELEKEQKKRAEAAKKETENSGESQSGEISASEETQEKETKSERRRKEKLAAKKVELNFTTGRGIILLNVPPNEVPADLSERKLTEAAKAIIGSGDLLLSEAIRRASPKFFADYAKSAAPPREEPKLIKKQTAASEKRATVKQVIARVMSNADNRAIAGLSKEDFTVLEAGKEREIISVEPSVAPFNLVLLLDVSGSVDNYVNFIRKTARSFINTVNPNDKIAVIIFSEDVKQISTFTTDKNSLSESLDTFDAGGGTAFYDALGYSLVHTLKPFKGENTAIITMTDGDDNRSFLSFDSLISSIQESGAIIYPLYVPSSLVAAAATANAETSIDPLRTRYMGLTSKAEQEGAKLAQVSGGVYYPIQRVGDLQKAYDDIVSQLRTAYAITYKSDGSDTGDTASPRLRIKVNRENTFVSTGAVKEVKKISKNDWRDNSEVSADSNSEDSEQSFFKKVSFQNDQNDMEIKGEITGIEYQPLLTQSLNEISIENFDINAAAPAFVLTDNQKKIGVSKWVSPKRTRSYPYERVYNTLSQPKKITVIPILKDEGANGERDFIQWDTISLMSLLEVYVVIGYYSDAEKSAKDGKITNQKLDNDFVISKLKEIENYHSSALHWNLKQLEEISATLAKAKSAYAKISQKTGVAMHNENGIENFARKISGDVNSFMEFSRRKSQQAQSREFVTLQPKESLTSNSKGRITITNYLGGKYYFTCDETVIDGDTLFIIEDKHSANGKLPAASDIKDGLLKMMLYANLKNVSVGDKKVNYKPVLRLTGGKLKGAVSSRSTVQELREFFALNVFTAKQKDFIGKLFAEAQTNRFLIKLESVATARLEDAQKNLQGV